jgi:hypothetical protein
MGVTPCYRCGKYLLGKTGICPVCDIPRPTPPKWTFSGPPEVDEGEIRLGPLPAELRDAYEAAQAKADELGHPVQRRIDLVCDGQVIATHVHWAFPLASFDQWLIIGDKPVRKVMP